MLPQQYRTLSRRLREVTRNCELRSVRQQALRACFEDCSARFESLSERAVPSSMPTPSPAIADEVLRWQSAVDELSQLHERYDIACVDKTDDTARGWQQTMRELAAARCALRMPSRAHPERTRSATD
jgi:hypothetical protein